MILHIVRSGETVRAIADNYQCEISDITSNNLHITDFKNLKPGMKLRIPFLTKPIMDVLEETESFIKDYYPNLDENFKSDFKETKDEVKEEPVVDIEPQITEEKPKENIIVTPGAKSDKEILKKEILIKKPCEKQDYRGNIIPNIPPQYIKKI